MKNIFLILIVAMFLLTLVSAEQQTLGTFGQNKCVILKQTCANCTFVNITSVTAKDNDGKSVTLLGHVGMTKNGSEYNYTFCSTGYVGEYVYNTLGDPDGILTTSPVTFNIGVNSVILYVLIFGLIYAIAFIGFFGKNIPTSILGGLAMIALGIFGLMNGIADYRIPITNIISVTTIGIGALFALTAGIEQIKETFGG